MTAKQFLSFDGRMRRKHYIRVHLCVLAAFLVIGLLQGKVQTSLAPVTFLVVAAVIPSCVRRLHDVGYSGWLVIGLMVIPIASLVLLLADSEPGPNAYGPNPKTVIAPPLPGAGAL
jgi:uncharacterized membrane protein YhaH (DUF805 family)